MPKKKIIMDSIARKNAAARAEGLSYGQWVAKHPEGLPPDFTVEGPELEEIETPQPAPAKKKRHHPRTKGMPETMSCYRCGKVFKPKAANAKYCGMECAMAAQRAKDAQRRVNPRPEKMPCAICGREFKPNAPNAKYCGEACAAIAWRKKKEIREAKKRMEENGV